MPFTFVCGFEDAAVTTHWSQTGGVAALDSTIAGRTGTNALRLDLTNVAAQQMVDAAQGLQAVQVRTFRFRTSALPTGDTRIAMLEGTVYDSRIVLQSTGTLTFTAGAGSASSASPIVANTWYRIDFAVDGANKLARWSIDGVAQTNPGVPASTQTINGLYLGKSSAVATGAISFYYDDVGASTSFADYPLPPGVVVKPASTEQWSSPAVVFACGGEAASEPSAGSHWDSVTGSVTKDSGHTRSGGNALKFVASASAAHVNRAVAAGNRVLVVRFALYMTDYPASGVRQLWEWGPDFNYARINTSGSVILVGGATSLAPLPLNQWVIIDFKVNASAATHVQDWKINGVAQPQQTNASAAADIGTFVLGNGASSTATWWVDDFVMSLTAADYPIADGSVVLNGSAEVWSEAHAGAFALAGGGVVTRAAAKGAQDGRTLTGGGVVSPSVLAGRQGAALLSGGGAIATLGQKDTDGMLELTGGGVVTIEDVAFLPDQKGTVGAAHRAAYGLGVGAVVRGSVGATHE